MSDAALEAGHHGLARDGLLELLHQRGADTLPHLNGPLLDHLLGTEALLRSWGCSDTVALAGLAHAAYGTDGFPDHLLELGEHELLREAGGADVEALVYLYASCHRRAVYPLLRGAEPVLFRDRFRAETFRASDEQVRDFCDVTVANEVELAVVVTGRPAPAWLMELFEDVRERLSPGVLEGAGQLLLA